MKQFKIFNDFEKEEEYLNSMAKRGFIFKKYSFLGFYHFFKGEKQSLNIRIDYRVFNNKKEFEKYKTMFSDFGWNHISGTAYSGKQYFLSIDKESTNELFSTTESFANRFKAMLKIFFMNILFMVVYCFSILECYWYNGSNFSIYDLSIWSLVPIILFFIVAIFYSVRSIDVYKKYKDKLRKFE